MKKPKQKIAYLNPKQEEFIQAKQRRKSLVAGRGFGKSSMIGFVTADKVMQMPRAKSMLIGPTYAHLLSKTVPAITQALESIGWWKAEKGKYGHFVVCQRPPSYFKTAYQEPETYKYVISFWNGYRIELISEDIGDNNRGGSYDSADIDESALISKEFIDKVVSASIRGNLHKKFAKSHYHHSVYDYTSTPWTPAGRWIYQVEELMKEYPEEYFFMEATALDNIHVLGEDYIKRLKAEMSSLEFDVEVMNKRIKKLPNAFYPDFDFNKHVALHTHKYEETDSNISVKGQNDYDTTQPLYISFDFNISFMSCIVAQKLNGKLCINNLFFVKYKKIDKLVDMLTSHYATHTNKLTFIYGDRMGNSFKQGRELVKMYDIIKDMLKQAGWRATLKASTRNIEHKLKHYVINKALQQEGKTMPISINANTCKALVLSIQHAGILDNYQKDKSSERDANTLQEFATHLSDCFDYLVYPLYLPTMQHNKVASSEVVLK